MSSSPSNPYDALPYHGLPIRATHPGCLAAIAQLVGVSAPNPRRCRVLELGCCDGGNLIAMAVSLPESSFTGIDYSKAQIEIGRQVINELALTNVQLLERSIMDITPDFGEFDFIVSHGVFSWVPPQVQDQLLTITHRHLAADGIGYISYNTYPGWHQRSIVRDLMRYHARRFEDPAQRLNEARQILDFVAGCAAGNGTEAYSIFLKSEQQMLAELPDYYLAHDHLEENCEPIYFHEFMKRAMHHGLEYLAEPSINLMVPANFGAVAARALAAVSSNLIEREQFMDFLRNRSFRQTLLRRTSQTPASYNFEPGRLHGLYLTGMVEAKGKVDLRPDQPVTFESREKLPITTVHPLLKAALFILQRRFPVSIQFHALLDQARAQLENAALPLAPRDRDETDLGASLMQLLGSTEMIAVSSLPSDFTIDIASMPVASPLARLQAKVSTGIFTLRHDSIKLEPFDAAVLANLDGTCGASEIAKILGQPEALIIEAIKRLSQYALLAA